MWSAPLPHHRICRPPIHNHTSAFILKVRLPSWWHNGRYWERFDATANQSFVLVVTCHLQETVENTTPACVCGPAAPAANQASLSSVRLIIGLGFVVGVAQVLTPWLNRCFTLWECTALPWLASTIQRCSDLLVHVWGEDAKTQIRPSFGCMLRVPPPRRVPRLVVLHTETICSQSLVLWPHIARPI